MSNDFSKVVVSKVQKFSLTSTSEPDSKILKLYPITTKENRRLKYSFQIKVMPIIVSSVINGSDIKDLISEPEDDKKTNYVEGLKLNGTLCDYEITCEEKKFYCYKAVLAANSKVFEV